jgi:hypothetical protein
MGQTHHLFQVRAYDDNRHSLTRQPGDRFVDRGSGPRPRVGSSRMKTLGERDRAMIAFC